MLQRPMDADEGPPHTFYQLVEIYTHRPRMSGGNTPLS